MTVFFFAVSNPCSNHSCENGVDCVVTIPTDFGELPRAASLASPGAFCPIDHVLCTSSAQNHADGDKNLHRMKFLRTDHALWCFSDNDADAANDHDL